LLFAVVNLDDACSEQIIAAVPEHVVLWGVSAKGKGLHAIAENVTASNIQHKADGMQFDVRWSHQLPTDYDTSTIFGGRRSEIQTVKVPLYGDFNIENVLTVLAVMLALGITLRAATQKLSQVKPVIGRMERLGDDAGPLVFVDYAHTPDALDKVLSCAKQHCEGDLWVVFGCGGNRDTGKRSLMGASAESWADHVIVTDDNPRYENGQDIINDILSGCSSAKVEVIRNREQAIHNVLKKADIRDCIVIAGKGHEQYQEIEGVQTPFSDNQVALEALRMRPKNSQSEARS
jgi:UDP-N-acetylmuramoyl-L-alanyl-D-glutamate--2,6-diaminopimelate ligase